jgi:hypothetical protein
LERKRTPRCPEGLRDASTGPKRRDVVGTALCFGTIEAVARDDGVDEMLMSVAGLFGAEADALERGRPKVGEEHVGVSHQLMQDASSPLVREIKGDAPLAPIVELEDRVDREIPPEHPAEIAGWIALWGLDFHNVGAPVGHDAARSRTRHPYTQLDDACSLEWTRHGVHRSESTIRETAGSGRVTLGRVTQSPAAGSPRSARPPQL